MLGRSDVMAFVPTREPEKAREFYENVLGLRFVSDDPFAVVFAAHNATIRLAKTESFTPAPYTILGWEVADLHDVAVKLQDAGVRCERFDMLEQDALGIWTSPSGARVAWFKDPDGNLLSLTQF